MPLPVCGVCHNLPNPLLNLGDVQRLIACELGAACVCACLVPKENALCVNAGNVVVPDAEMPESPVSGSDWFFEILAAPPHENVEMQERRLDSMAFDESESGVCSPE